MDEFSKNEKSIEIKKPQFSIEHILQDERTNRNAGTWKPTHNDHKKIKMLKSDCNPISVTCKFETVSGLQYVRSEKRFPTNEDPELIKASDDCIICEREKYLRHHINQRKYIRNCLTVPYGLDASFGKRFPCAKPSANIRELENRIYPKRLHTEQAFDCEICDMALPPLIPKNGPLPPLIYQGLPSNTCGMNNFDRKPAMLPFGIFNTSQPQYQNQRSVQVRFTTNQSQQLEKAFEAHKYISNDQRKQLAKDISLSERQVKTWFQNRRAKWRRIKLEGKLSDDSSKEDQLPIFKYLC